jgi:hypothetical protein
MAVLLETMWAGESPTRRELRVVSRPKSSFPTEAKTEPVVRRRRPQFPAIIREEIATNLPPDSRREPE